MRHFVDIVFTFTYRSNSQDGRVVKALDLSSNGQMSAWVRTPLLASSIFDRLILSAKG